MGQVSRQFVPIDPAALMGSCLTISGFYLTNVINRQEMYHESLQYLLELALDQKLKPMIGKVLPLSNAVAMHRLAENCQTKGKSILLPEDYYLIGFCYKRIRFLYRDMFTSSGDNMSNLNEQVEEKIHLTDLDFSKLCQEKYGINRGVYNCIDTTFYESGFKNILVRRKMTLCFLEFISRKMSQKIKFGPKGLRKSIDEYLALNGDQFNDDKSNR